jgi:putative transcriptional regulator
MSHKSNNLISRDKATYLSELYWLGPLLEEKAPPTAILARPDDPDDRPVSVESMDRGQRAELIRDTRVGLGLSQPAFAALFHVPVGTLRDWEQGRATPPAFAVAYVRVIRRYPDLVAAAVA